MSGRASGILFHPREAVLVREVVAQALLVLGLDAHAERIAVRRERACVADGLPYAGESVRIVHLISIHTPVVDFFPDGIERSRVDAVAREIPEGLGVIEDLS